MKIFSLLAFYLTFSNLLSYVTSYSDENSSDKKEIKFKLERINEEDFIASLNTITYGLIILHNPWCKISQNLEKKLEEINDILTFQKDLKMKIYAYLIDVTTFDLNLLYSKIPNSFIGDEIYPKIVIMHYDKPLEVYKGRLNVYDISTHIKRLLYPILYELKSVYEIEPKLKIDRNAYIFFGDIEGENQAENNNTRSKLLEVYEDHSVTNKEILFYYTEDADITNQLNPSRNATVIYYKLGKQKDTLIFNDNDNKQKFELYLKRFINKNTYKNIFNKINEEVIHEVVMKNQSALVLFRNPYFNKTETLEENFPILAAGDMKTKYVICDLTSKKELKFANLLGVKDSDLPTMRILDMRDGIKRYHLNSPLNLENVMKFIKDWKKGYLHPYPVNEQYIKDNTVREGRVKKVNEEDYYLTIEKSRKVSVVLFYASWCSHCKKVIPIMEALANKFPSHLISFYLYNMEEVDSETFAKHGVNVEKVPTMVLYTTR